MRRSIALSLALPSRSSTSRSSARPSKNRSSSTSECSASNSSNGRRPSTSKEHSERLHKYGMGIHLLQRSSDSNAPAVARPTAINPKGNHISFQCTDMGLMKMRLPEMELELVATRVRDGETVAEQLFFHDPDGNVIEICDCEKLPVIPLADAAAGLPNLLVPA